MSKIKKHSLDEELTTLIDKYEQGLIAEGELKTYLLNKDFDVDLDENSSFIDHIKKLADKTITSNTHIEQMAQHNQYIDNGVKKQLVFGWNNELNCLKVDIEEVTN